MSGIELRESMVLQLIDYYKTIVFVIIAQHSTVIEMIKMCVSNASNTSITVKLILK